MLRCELLVRQHLNGRSSGKDGHLVIGWDHTEIVYAKTVFQEVIQEAIVQLVPEPCWIDIFLQPGQVRDVSIQVILCACEEPGLDLWDWILGSLAICLAG